MKKPISILLSFALAACGFHALHGQQYRSQLGVDLSAVQIEVDNSRRGQLLESEIREGADPDFHHSEKLYVLKVKLADSIIPLFINPDGTSSRGDIQYTSSYTLSRLKDGKVVDTGSITRVSSYNTSQNADYASYVSEQDARTRGILELAQAYKLRLANLLPTLNGKVPAKKEKSVKPAAREIDAFLRAPGTATGALIYGLDGGQVRQRIARLTESWVGPNAESMSSMEIPCDKIKEDPTILSDELAAMSLMAAKRVILVRDAEDAILPAVEEATQHRAPGNFLILYAMDSLAGTKLRAWIERSATFAAIPCYKDEGADLDTLLRDSLRGYGLRAAPEVIAYLSSQLGGDRQIILNELEKLSLYVGDEAEEVFLDDAMQVVGENNDKSLDDLAHAVSMGDISALAHLSDRLINEGQPGVVLVRHVMRSIARLEQIAAQRAEGTSLDAAIEGLRPPVFFKIKPALKSQAQRWSLNACADALAKLQLLELDSKRYSDQSLSRLAHGFMEIAALPSPARRAA